MKTYLFDFDGTLVDSMPTYVSAMLKILDDEKISYADDIIKTITPLGVLGTARLYKEMGVRKSLEEIVSKMQEYAFYEYENNIPAKKNVVTVLKSLKEAGNSLNVLTASPHVTLDPCLKRIGIWELFDNIWSCDDFNTTKADVNIYKSVAKKIGVPISEVLFLDDNLNADKTAKAAGMQVCGVYDDSSAEFIDEIKAVSDFYITDFSELLEIEF